MTDAELITLALCPRVIIPSRREGVGWPKQCNLCPQRFYDDCQALNLAGLPIRCQQKTAEEVAMLREALECAS